MNRSHHSPQPATGERAIEALKPVETWRQDPHDPDLWHHSAGLMIVNHAALEERTRYYRVIRLGAADAPPEEQRHRSVDDPAIP